MRGQHGVVWLAAGILGLAALALAFERPAPLFVNLGAGDTPFARGFRDRWERDGLNQTGETMFRWALDGSRLEIPVALRSGRFEARVRVARFTETPAEVALLVGGRVVDQWLQPPRGWRVRRVDLGEPRGPLTLQFRSKEGSAGLGVALDWVEVRGRGIVLPNAWVCLRLLALLAGVPLLLALAGEADLARLLAVVLPAIGAVAVALDRLGGLLALAGAAVPSLVCVGALTLFVRGLTRFWPDTRGPRMLWIPAIAMLLALVALSQPFFYYNDIDNHARFLAALRADPALVLDSTPYQLKTAAFTREIAGQRVAFPYSPLFHVLAWPLAVVMGEIPAIKAVAAAALGFTLVLVHALARALGLPQGVALVAQGVAVFLPTIAWDVSLARFPTLLGQSQDLLLLVFLARRFETLDARGGILRAAAFFAAAQASYTGSIVNAGVFVALLFVGEAVFGNGARALRLLGAYALATTVVVATLYAWFLPVLWREVLPHVGEAQNKASVPESAWAWLGIAATRLAVFYDGVYPLLTLVGITALRAAAPSARRVLGAALLTGLALLLLRFRFPAIFRDAKEVQFLVAPVAVAAAAALRWLWSRGHAGRSAAGILAFAAVTWGGNRALASYAERFLAVAR